MISKWEIIIHIALEAYKAKCAQLIKEMDEEGASEDKEEDTTEAALGARF